MPTLVAVMNWSVSERSKPLLYHRPLHVGEVKASVCERAHIASCDKRDGTWSLFLFYWWTQARDHTTRPKREHAGKQLVAGPVAHLFLGS